MVNGSVADAVADFQRAFQSEFRPFARVTTADLKSFIEAETPVKTGLLRRSFYVKRGASTGPEVSYSVLNRQDYAPWVEWDTGRHRPGGQYIIITPKRAKYLKFRGRTGETVYTKLVKHPGSAGAHMFAKGAARLDAELPKRCDWFVRKIARQVGL
jgi:hypothetical protein